MNLTALAIGLPSVAALALGGAAWWQSGRVGALKEDLAAAEASLRTSEQARAQAISAAAVSDKTLAIIADREDRQTALLLDAMTGDDADVPCPIDSGFFDDLRGLDGSGLLP